MTMTKRQKLTIHQMPLLSILLWQLTIVSIELSCPLVRAEKLKDGKIYKDNSIRSYYDFALRRQKCKDKVPEENAGKASLIFTGTVRDVQPDERGHERAEVEVKRVIKGAGVMDQLPMTFVEGKYASMRHRVVTVHGIGQPDICVSRVRKHDTWIFFTNVISPPGELWLNSSLVRLSLASIAEAEASVRDKNYISKNINQTAPCEQKFCPFGGQCILNHLTRMMECRCTEICVSTFASPVCGSDGITYENECRLRIMSCLQRRHIRVLWNDSCDSRDPCMNVKCGFGAKCVPSTDRLSADCQCPKECSEYGVDENSIPICSDDGTQYDDLCHVKRMSCREKKEIQIRNVGVCDPCWNVHCSVHSFCSVDEQMEPKCICQENCTTHEDHVVCGSDNHDYRNQCEMELAACQRQQNIFVVSNGTCASHCGECQFGTECHGGTCVPVCPPDCPADDGPVCATDHVTYASTCEVLTNACYLNSSLAVLYHGECMEMSGSEESCDDLRCSFGATCESDGDGLRCSCNFECGAIRSSVCGSDGMPYLNECYLREAACRQQQDIQLESYGNCEDFEEDLCDGNSVLANSTTDLEYDCFPGRDTCPEESYCHIVKDMARCCAGAVGQSSSLCTETEFGCCPDKVTIALGPNFLGCLPGCRCHPLGSISQNCDPESGLCVCKVGVGGPQCDRCEPNYWGMPKIAEGNDGCIPCDCNVHGSIREDCVQMTGVCMCRRFVFGPKCDFCADGSRVAESGCPDNETVATDEEPLNIEMKNRLEDAALASGSEEFSRQSLPTSTLRPVAVDYSIPSFSGMSYIQLRSVQHGKRDMSIEIEFRPLSLNGLILYAGQNDHRTSDFISIVLKNGYVEFRYDLGSGPTLLRTSQPVILKKLHKVTATRYGKDGLLKMDEGSESSTVSPGAMRTLELNTSLYLGYVPNFTEQISRNTGANSGFVGCVQSLRIASTMLNKEYELAKATSNDIEADSEIGECDLRSCKTVLCQNGGVCKHNDSNYTCTCPSGFTGVLCENEVADDL